MPLAWAFAVVAGVNLAAGPADSQPLDAAIACEVLAGDEFDHERLHDRAAEDPATLARAEAACREAVEVDPDIVRLRYNLGRTLAIQERPEAVGHLRWAAERGHPAAQFRLGKFCCTANLVKRRTAGPAQSA